jgi:hypothetical protein
MRCAPRRHVIAIVHADPRASAAMGIDDMQISMVDRLAALNLFSRNLIFAFPIDGSRVLRSRAGWIRACYGKRICSITICGCTTSFKPISGKHSLRDRRHFVAYDHLV